MYVCARFSSAKMRCFQKDCFGKIIPFAISIDDERIIKNHFEGR